MEPAAVHGGNMKVLGLVLGMKLLGIGAARGSLSKNWTQEHSTQVLCTSMFLQCKAVGLASWPDLRDYDDDWMRDLESGKKSFDECYECTNIEVGYEDKHIIVGSTEYVFA